MLDAPLEALNFLQITTDSADRSNTSAAWDIPQGLVLPEERRELGSPRIV